MAYYGRRRGYGYRRRAASGLIKLLVFLIFIGACALAVWQTGRVELLKASEKKLEQQIAALEGEPVDTSDTSSEIDKPQTSTIAYQHLYPKMTASIPKQFEDIKPKAVYLTFEGGPSDNTVDILDALKAANQKATFFVAGKDIEGNEDIIKRIVDEGHTLGTTGYSNDYELIYSSVTAFLDDFNKAYELIHDTCGEYPVIYRFPGGSVNGYNRGTYREIIAELTRRGFMYFDWNINAQDATGRNYDAATLQSLIINGINETEQHVVLLHDAEDNDQTAKLIPDLLEDLDARGFYCDKLIPSSAPVTFSYFK